MHNFCFQRTGRDYLCKIQKPFCGTLNLWIRGDLDGGVLRRCSQKFPEKWADTSETRVSWTDSIAQVDLGKWEQKALAVRPLMVVVSRCCSQDAGQFLWVKCHQISEHWPRQMHWLEARSCSDFNTILKIGSAQFEISLFIVKWCIYLSAN